LFGELDAGLDAILDVRNHNSIVKRHVRRGRALVYRELLLLLEEGRGSKSQELESHARLKCGLL